MSFSPYDLDADDPIADQARALDDASEYVRFAVHDQIERLNRFGLELVHAPRRVPGEGDAAYEQRVHHYRTDIAKRAAAEALKIVLGQVCVPNAVANRASCLKPALARG